MYWYYFLHVSMTKNSVQNFLDECSGKVMLKVEHWKKRTQQVKTGATDLQNYGSLWLRKQTKSWKKQGLGQEHVIIYRHPSRFF